MKQTLLILTLALSACGSPQPEPPEQNDTDAYAAVADSFHQIVLGIDKLLFQPDTLSVQEITDLTQLRWSMVDSVDFYKGLSEK